MLTDGFLYEVQALRAHGDLHPDLPAMRYMVYRQAWEALVGFLPVKELRNEGIIATRQLAKRQITWLRSNTQRKVVAFDAPDALQQVLTLASDFLRHSTTSLEFHNLPDPCP